MSPALLQALVDAELIELCARCLKSRGLCEPCLEREGPRFAGPSIWLRLMGQLDGDGCPKCGGELETCVMEDGAYWLHCTGPSECNYWMRVQTREEREAQKEYEAKAEKRAHALARATAAASGKFVRNRTRTRSAPRIPVRQVA